MSDLILHKKNEAFIQFECDRNIAQELSDYFTFYVPGYQFVPAYKSRLWDGKIRLADLRSFSIYHGLVPYIEKFCKERDYTLEIDSDVSTTENYSAIEAAEFVKSLNLPHEIRDYQLKSFVQAIRNKRMLLLSPTASGKSLVLYCIIRYLQIENGRGLLIVPTTSLVEQMYKDFEDYGYDSDQYCHRQYSGKDKHTNKFLTITTWQSIYKNPGEYFEQFDFVLGDEAHQFKAKSLTTILSGCTNAKYRIGTTGTLDDSKVNKLVLEGLFGPVFKVISTKELIERKQLANFSIKCIVLKYPEIVCKAIKGFTYPDEMNFLTQHEGRNNFICDLAINLKGNSLILFTYVEKHGKILYESIKERCGNRKVFFIHGGVEAEDREAVRHITEQENDAIIVASYGTFSTGVNIRNLHNIVFSSPTKSKIRSLQSIGRVLRLGENKDAATLYDIADDSSTKTRRNYTLNHFIERIKIYNEENFNYEIITIQLKKNGN